MTVNTIYAPEHGIIPGMGEDCSAALHLDGCTVRNTRARGFLVQTTMC